MTRYAAVLPLFFMLVGPAMGQTNDVRKTETQTDDEVTLLKLKVAALQKEVEQLKASIELLRLEMASRTENSTSRKNTTDARPATVVLENKHDSWIMQTTINGVMHVVPPGSSKSISVPSGDSRIQVMQTDAKMRTNPLMPGEVRLLTMQ